MKNMRAFLSVGILAVLVQAAASATDWPEYHGPNHDGTSAEKVKLDWGTSKPHVLWTTPTPDGFSSFSIGGGKCFTEVTRAVNGAEREGCLALDATTGKEAWFVDTDQAKYDGGGDSGTNDNKGGDGPRSTPTFSDGMVYVLSANLSLYCLDAQSGKQVWKKDLLKEHAGRNIQWQNAASPVIDGELLFVAGGGPGQTYLGINKKTGAVAWKTGDDLITHSTPTIATILGERQVIFFVQKGLVAVSPKDGKTLWRYPFKYSTSTAISPVVSGDEVYCSAGYGVGGGACKISKEGDGFKVTETLPPSAGRKVVNHWSTPVVKDGYLYGMFSFKKYGDGPMKCVELATGNVMWEEKGFGAGNVILVGDKVLALADSGELVVVDASPKKYTEICRAKVVSGKCWSTPALSDGKIYVRSTTEGACIESGQMMNGRQMLAGTQHHDVCRPFLFGLSVLMTLSLVTGAVQKEEPKMLEIGAAAPDFALPGVDGKSYSLKDFANAKVLVVIFTCNHCPTAQAYEKRIMQLDADFKEKGVAMVAISPNDPLAVRLDELGYTDLNDTLEEMKIRAGERGFKFPYLV